MKVNPTKAKAYRRLVDAEAKAKQRRQAIHDALMAATFPDGYTPTNVALEAESSDPRALYGHRDDHGNIRVTVILRHATALEADIADKRRELNELTAALDRAHGDK